MKTILSSAVENVFTSGSQLLRCFPSRACLPLALRSSHGPRNSHGSAKLVATALLGTLLGCAADGPHLISDVINYRTPLRSDQADFGLQIDDEPAQRIQPRKADAVPLEITSSIVKNDATASSTNNFDPSAFQTSSGKKRPPPVVVPQSAFDDFDIHQEEITSVVITKDGSRAYTGGSDGSVISSTIIKPESKNKQGGWSLEVKRLLKGERGISALALSPDERYMAIAQFSSVLVYDLQDQTFIHRMTRITGKFPAMSWDPRGELLIFGRTSGEVYAWHISSGKAAGQDSLNAIEQYGSAGGAGVKVLMFHPSGRAFVVAEEDGGVTVWRLLRTESELGLRDPKAAIDDTNAGSKNSSFGKIPFPIDDAWMDSRGEELFVSANDGNVYRWKVRGLQQGPQFQIGNDSIQAMQGIDLGSVDIPGSRFLITSGRGQRFKFWCRPHSFNDDDNEPSWHRITVMNSQDSAATKTPVQIIEGRLVLPEDPNPKPIVPLKKTRAVTSGFLVGESVSMVNPISFLRGSKNSTILWGVVKKGSLVVFDSGPILSSFRANCPAE